MSVAALLLVLASAFLHAAWNALLKRSRDVNAASSGALAIAVLVAAAFALLAPGGALPGRTAAWALASGLLEGGYVLCLVAVLDRAPLGWSYAWMRGSAVLAVWPLALMLQGEGVALLPALGVAAVAAGLLLMGGRADAATPRWVPALAVVGGACISGYNLCYKAALARNAHPSALFALSLGVGLAVQLLVGRWRGRLPNPAALRREPLLVLLCGLGCAGSFLLYLGALKTEGAARVTTLRNTSVVFAQLMALGLGERPTRRHWAGAVLVTLGAVALGLR